jgi:hypothetical protein
MREHVRSASIKELEHDMSRLIQAHALQIATARSPSPVASFTSFLRLGDPATGRPRLNLFRFRQIDIEAKHVAANVANTIVHS